MSKKAFVKVNYATEEIKLNQLDNSIDIFKKPLPVFKYNKFPQSFSLDNKNGVSRENIKRDANTFSHFESKSGEKMPKLEKSPNNINCIYNHMINIVYQITLQLLFKQNIWSSEVIFFLNWEIF